jgi:ketosteroid isomerase-like protein
VDLAGHEYRTAHHARRTEIPAIGKKVELPGVAVVTVRDGKIASERDYVDMAAMMSQLGLMPGT